MKKTLGLLLSVVMLFGMLSAGITAFAAAGDTFDMTVSVTLDNALPDGYTLWINANFFNVGAGENWTTVQLTSTDGRNFTATVEDAVASSAMGYGVYWSPTDTMQDWSRKLTESTMDTTAGAAGTYQVNASFTPPDPDTLFDMDITVNLANALPVGYTLWINGDFSGAGSNWTSYKLTAKSATTYTVTVPSAVKTAALKYSIVVSETEEDSGIDWNNKWLESSFDTTAGTYSTYAVQLNNPVIDPENTFTMTITVNLSQAIGNSTLWISANFQQKADADWGAYQLEKVNALTYSLTVRGVTKAEYTDYKLYLSESGAWEDIDWETAIAEGSFDTTAGADGTYRIQIQNGTGERQPGDVNGDGFVNSGDARLVLQSTVGLAELTPEQETYADVYDDGLINSSDARVILQMAVGLA